MSRMSSKVSGGAGAPGEHQQNQQQSSNNSRGGNRRNKSNQSVPHSTNSSNNNSNSTTSHNNNHAQNPPSSSTSTKQKDVREQSQSSPVVIQQQPPPAPSSSPVPPIPLEVEDDDVDEAECEEEPDEDDVDFEVDVETEDGVLGLQVHGCIDLEVDGDIDDDEDDDDDDQLIGDHDRDADDGEQENPLELDLDPDGEESPDCEPNAQTPGPANNSASSFNSPLFLGSTSEDEDDDDVGEVDESLDREESDDEDDEDDDGLEPPGFLLPPDGDGSSIQGIPPDAQARLEAFFEAAGFTDGKLMSDPENLRKLTLTVSSALGEASAAINRMRDSQRKSIEEGRNDSMEEGDSLLALACSSGYFELARVLLAMGANVDDRGSKGDLTPLMDASSQGHLEIVRLLLSHGADVNAQSACGNSPLMYACASGHEEIVKDLLKAGARVEDNNENGHTPLMEAASAGHVPVAKILLEHGAGINTHSNEFKESALTVACYKGHLEMVRFLLSAGADQQHKTDEMHTALMEASMDGHVEVARLLLDSGAQVNMPADSFESPLTLAACGGHVELAELLIERGANIEEVNDEGYTPLMEAAREGHLSVVKSLLKNDAKINAQTEETHETALTLAACGGFLDVVDTLVNAGAEIELGASTPLMEASQEGHYPVVKYLLDRGADILRQTQTGDTALSYACENGHTDVVELLMEKGADHVNALIEHLSEGGRTPLMKACRGGHIETIKFLLSKGADVNRQTASNDHTPLSLACAGGHISSVEVLLAAGANPYHKLKDNSTMIIEAARGGHTQVIRTLLDFSPHKNDKSGKQGQAKAGSSHSGHNQKAHNVDTSKTGANQNQAKSVLRKSRSTSTLDSAAAQQQIVLQKATTDAGTSSEAKGKQVQQLPPMTSIPLDSPILKTLNMPHGDGKSGSSGLVKQIAPDATPTTSTDTRKKPVAITSVVNSEASKQAGGASSQLSVGVASGTTGQRKTVAAASSTGNSVCMECAKTNAEQQQGHVHVKRPAAAEPLSPSGRMSEAISVISSPGGASGPAMVASSTASSSASSGGASSGSVGGNVPSNSSGTAMSTLSTGPPLVPSQVTAATAISERPKAKANKPSARKQVQLQQQQLQQQLQQQQQFQQQLNHCQGQVTSPGGNNSTVNSPGASPNSPNTSSPGSSPGGAILSPTSPEIQQSLSNRIGSGSSGTPTALKLPASPNPSFMATPALLQMQVQQVRNTPSGHFKLDPKQLSHIFTQHQQQFVYTKGDKSGFEPYENIEGTPEMIDFAHVLAAGTYTGNYPTATPSGLASVGVGTPVALSGGSPVGTTTTTTTTTVVVTHGNGDTETIIEGDNLPPGANEMIMNAAAAAAFPLDCFQMPGTIQMNPASGVQVQSYQLSSPTALSASDLAAISPMTTTTMHTTTIINSAGTAFQPQILLPHHQHHPPPLPSAIVAAAAAAGIVPPSGAPPPGALQQSKSGTSAAASKTKAVSGASASAGGNVKGQVQSQQNLPQQPQLTTSTVSVATATQGTQAPQAPCTAAMPAQKKQTAKRTRPFSQQPGTVPTASSVSSNIQGGTAQPRQSNQQTQTQHTHVHHHVKPGSHSVASTQTPISGQQEKVSGAAAKALDVDSATESNGETSLSIAAASGHYEVVEFLIGRKAHIEHRDKKGCTPLILASDGGHEKVVELLLNHGADIEAQSERTKDTALSLACTKGRYEVVELLLKRGANKEHRNVSDYTPLSLAASGGYVNIIKLLLQSGAEINSRTGSKLGISPLMLAAMNGNTAAVKLLLDMGSDINAQIETNKNTALTLACFQGRQEVVSLLLERKANLEHRAKTGLTPLMEAANGGYTDVGKVLLDKGADVNAPPVPATRDTALTIASDKGHYRFVELLLARGALVDVRNKKGCTPLWLACHGGHLDVAQILFRHGADLDVQDNRRLSCLMAAFRKGHVKVIRWIVKNVQQFPSDGEMSRYFVSLSAEPDLLKKCQQCAEYIKQAKDKQALEANKNANILLEELDMEKSREESKRLAAARRREKKKKKKMEKKQQYSGTKDDDDDDENDDDGDGNQDDEDNDDEGGGHDVIDSGIDANSQGSNSSVGDNRRLGLNQLVHHSSNLSSSKSKGNKENLQQQIPERKQTVPKNIAVIEPVVDLTPPTTTTTNKNRKKKNKNKQNTADLSQPQQQYQNPSPVVAVEEKSHIHANVKHHQQAVIDKDNKNVSSNKTKSEKEILKEKVKEVEVVELTVGKPNKKDKKNQPAIVLEDKKGNIREKEIESHLSVQQSIQMTSSKAAPFAGYGGSNKKQMKGMIDNSNANLGGNTGPEPLMGISLNPSQLRKSAFDHEMGAHPHMTFASVSTGVGNVSVKSNPNRKDDGWKEVTRSCPSSRSKKVIVPSSVISRVIGRGGCNINAIREATGAHIEVEKQQKGQVQPERTIQIKGSAEATKQAHNLITALMNEPDLDVKKLLPSRVGGASVGLMSSISTPSIVTGTTTYTNSNHGGILSTTPVDILIPPLKPLTVTGTPAIVKSASGSQVGVTKGSPSPLKNMGVSNAPASPPLLQSSSSPPIKKPTPVTSGGMLSTSAPQQCNLSLNGNLNTLFKNSSNSGSNSSSGSGIGKRSIVITPSTQTAAISGNPNVSFASKLVQQSNCNANQGMNANSGSGFGAANLQRNITPTPITGGNMKTVTPTPVAPATPTITPPPQSASPVLNVSNPSAIPTHQQQNIHMVYHQQQKVERQIQPGVIPIDRQMQQVINQNQNILQGLNLGPLTAPGPVGGLERNSATKDNIIKNSNQVVNGPVGNPIDTGFSQRNLAPGNNSNPGPVGQNAVGRERNVNERGDGSASSTQPLLEYSPFNYTFSKTTGWLPSDLRPSNPSSSSSNHQPSGHEGPLISSLSNSNISSASRAMNFASVAASGIASSSLSTTTAHMTQAVGVHNGNGLVGSNVASNITSSLGLNATGKANSIVDGLDTELPKADASKAPGYRGNTTMGSPILRMQQQQVVPNVQNSAYNIEGPLSSHFAAAAGITTAQPGALNPSMMAFNQVQGRPPHNPSIGQNYGHIGAAHNQHVGASAHGPVGSQFGSQHDVQAGLMSSQQHQGVGSQMNYSNNSGGVPGPVPTNVVMSSRLNPRAPSFNLPIGKSPQTQPQTQPQSQPQQPSTNSSMSYQQNQYSAIHQQQQFKNLTMNQFSRNVGGTSGRTGQQHQQAQWMGYGGAAGGNGGSGTNDSMMEFPMTPLSNASGGAIDPQTLIESTIHDNQSKFFGDISNYVLKMEDRRLPRPIGGERQERAWKNTGTSGVNTMGNITPFNPMDCLDTNQISQPISLQPQGNHTVGHGSGGPTGGPNPQQQPWLNMYGGGGANANQQQSQYTNSNQSQQQQPHVNSHAPPGPNRDTRNFLGRRFMEEVDANRLIELQQQHMYDVTRGSMMNGGVPPMMHMQNPGSHQQPMYPFNMEHMEQHPIPKIDHNSWGDTSHVLMDDKHMNWGGGNKWGN